MKIKKYPLTFDCISKVAKTPGIYIISTDFKFPRLKGKTDILYIGKGDNLRNRLLTFFKGLKFCEAHKHSDPRPVFRRRHAIWRFWNLQSQGFKILFSTVKSETKQKPEELENEYLIGYEKRHLEIPPLNHQSGKKKSRSR